MADTSIDTGCECCGPRAAPDALGTAAASGEGVRIAIGVEQPGGVGLACTLADGPDAVRRRIDDWQALLGRAVGNEPTDTGMAFAFAHDVALAGELARLAAAESECCTFFSFSLTVDAEGIGFAVHAPGEAREALAAVFAGPGTPAGSRGGAT